MGKVDICTEMVINRPCPVVSKYAADPDHATSWYVNIKGVEWKTPRPLRLHSKIAFRARFLGRELEYVYEITEFVRGKKLVMRSAKGPFPMETTYRWEAHGQDQTKMTLRTSGEPDGFSKWFAPVMTVALRLSNHNDLRRLKRILESPVYGM